MTWIRRYRLRNFLSASIWIAPLLSVVAAVALHRLLWWLDDRTRWAWLNFSPEGARAAVGTITSSMLTFMVFTFSILLLAVQIAGSQLSPRIISLAMRNRFVKGALAIFVFTFTYSLGVLSRIENGVAQLPMVVIVLSCFASLGMFLYLVDRMAKSLRPTGIIGRIALEASRVIEDSYPHPLVESGVERPEQTAPFLSEVPRTVYFREPSGMLQAVDGPGLAELAHRNRCTIRLAPQVGDFVTRGEPLFHIYQGGQGIDDRELHRAVAVGPEQTLEQDPRFAFRIIVDIASKALSPAINDPSTAVLALDQIQRLLRVIGKRHLGDGTIRDAEGVVRVILPTPNWEDFVNLGMSEIRLFGANSIQVVRRLRAMIETLLAVLPERRHAALQEQLKLLDRTVERSFADPADRAYAGTGDYQGMGSSRGDHSTGGSTQEG
jgi:uncharacterized membrane protein